MHGGNIYEEPIEYDFSVNINPMDCQDILQDAYKRALGKMDTYPDLHQRDFLSSISKLEGLSTHEIIGGNGASELFMAMVRAISPKSAVLICPSFSGYRYALDSLKNCQIINYYLEKESDFRLNGDFIDFIDRMNKKPDLIFLANPNNPTGLAVDNELLEQIIGKCHKLDISLILDECFVRLSSKAKSFKDKIHDFPNLYVVDAFTKSFAIPGARVGYLCSQKENIDLVRAQLPEWNLSVLGQELGGYCAELIMREDFLERSQQLIEKERDFLQEKLLDCGIRVFPSDTNYLLLESQKDLFNGLRKQGILIRDCSDYYGLGQGYYRVAVKNHQENARLIEAVLNIN